MIISRVLFGLAMLLLAACGSGNSKDVSIIRTEGMLVPVGSAAEFEAALKQSLSVTRALDYQRQPKRDACCCEYRPAQRVVQSCALRRLVTRVTHALETIGPVLIEYLAYATRPHHITFPCTHSATAMHHARVSVTSNKR